MATDKKPTPSENKNISIDGSVVDSIAIAGDNNQTVFKRLSITYSQATRRLSDSATVAFFMIFLRRVGGGYIFVHRLLMEHFAEKYVESPTSKGN
jgi:hypothetical protein